MLGSHAHLAVLLLKGGDKKIHRVCCASVGIASLRSRGSGCPLGAMPEWPMTLTALDLSPFTSQQPGAKGPAPLVGIQCLQGLPLYPKQLHRRRLGNTGWQSVQGNPSSCLLYAYSELLLSSEAVFLFVCLLSCPQLDWEVHGGKDFVSLVTSVPAPYTELGV